jgi:hypothetical protein
LQRFLVVQHKKERWRGIITGWQRHDATGVEKLSSLTKKTYSGNKGDVLDLPTAVEEVVDDNGIQYSLILDSGDAHLLGGRRNVHDLTGEPVAMQSDLEVVEDDR